MRLSDLEATFVRRVWDDGEQWVGVDSLGDADGLKFLCPKCFAAAGSAVGVHWILCWFEGRVPDSVAPGPGRWRPAGTGVGDLTFAPGNRSASVLIVGGCAAHFLVANGEIR